MDTVWNAKSTLGMFVNVMLNNRRLILKHVFFILKYKHLWKLNEQSKIK